MSFLNGNKTPIGYGAIMYNGSTGGIESWYPFFTSQGDLGALPAISSSSASGTISIGDVDDYWTVMPGYKLEVYNNANYSIILLTGDNTNGTTPTSYLISSRNVASSLKLYYKNILINQPNPVRVTASNFSNSYVVAYNSINYRVYEYYAGSTGTLSFSASSTISSVECLLIGGGGSGAHMNSYFVGVGGGGAGAFLTTTIPVTAGDTFTINVGAGGAAPLTGRAGSIGSASSIQRFTGGNTSTLTAGGGGGGGGGVGGYDDYTGPKGNPWGSTGGVCPWAPTTVNATVASNSFTQTSAVFGTVTSYVNPGGTASYVFYQVAGPTDVRAGGSGGGGAGGVGGNNGGTNTASGGAGGAGKAWAVNGITYAGGGGGLVCPIGVGGTTNGAVGSGGGGAFGVAVTENTGSGGGPGFQGTAAGKGANGICIIAVPI